MRIKGAMTVLNKRAKFYGKTFDELIKMNLKYTNHNSNYMNVRCSAAKVFKWR